jgi:carbon monoxide dehydrogenase subunit G
MLMENSFSVPAPPDQVWNYFQDFNKVAACAPGAELTAQQGNQIKGKVAVKMGPVKLGFAGTVDIVERNDAAKRMVLNATGGETSGKGQATAKVTMQIVPSGNGSTVKVSQDIAMSGAVAQFGRGMMQDVTGVMMKQFADCIAGAIRGGKAHAGGPKSLSGFSLMMISLKSMFKRMFSFGKK